MVRGMTKVAPCRTYILVIDNHFIRCSILDSVVHCASYAVHGKSLMNPEL